MNLLIVLVVHLLKTKKELKNLCRQKIQIISTRAKKKTDCSAKINKIKGKIPSISGLATNSALTAVENKIPVVNSLVNKTDYNTKIKETEKKVADHNHDKHVTIADFNKLTAEIFDVKLGWENLARKNFDDKLKSQNQKINLSKTKHLLVKTKFKKLQIFDSIYFRSKSHLEKDGTQNCLVFQPMHRDFKRLSGAGAGNYIFVENLKDCLMKILQLLKHLIINLISTINLFCY